MEEIEKQEKIIRELSEKFQKVGEENMLSISFKTARFCAMIANSGYSSEPIPYV